MARRSTSHSESSPFSMDSSKSHRTAQYASKIKSTLVSHLFWLIFITNPWVELVPENKLPWKGGTWVYHSTTWHWPSRSPFHSGSFITYQYSIGHPSIGPPFCKGRSELWSLAQPFTSWLACLVKYYPLWSWAPMFCFYSQKAPHKEGLVTRHVQYISSPHLGDVGWTPIVCILPATYHSWVLSLTTSGPIPNQFGLIPIVMYSSGIQGHIFETHLEDTVMRRQYFGQQTRSITSRLYKKFTADRCTGDTSLCPQIMSPKIIEYSNFCWSNVFLISL